MEDKKQKSIGQEILILFLVLMSLGLLFFGSPLKQNQTDFIDNYAIALNDYHVAFSYATLAQTNYQLGTWYSSTEDYVYGEATDYYDEAIDSIEEATRYLTEARTIFSKLETSDSFYKLEVENRIKQTEALSKATEDYYELSELALSELYEINYGSDQLASEYYDSSLELIKKLNLDLGELSDVSNEIDSEWGKDWYLTFRN